MENPNKTQSENHDSRPSTSRTSGDSLRTTLTRIRPFPGQVIVRRAREAEVSEGGILIPLDAQRELAHGEVLAVGLPPKTISAMFPAEGDLTGLVGRTIFWKSFAGTEVSVDDDTYFFLEYEDILGVLEETL